MSGELPDGWRWARLGEVCDVVMGQSPPGSTYRSAPEGVPFFQGKAEFGDLHPTPRVWCVDPRKMAAPGDVLISVRAPVGPTNVADTACCIGRGLAALRARTDVNRSFLLYAVRAAEERIAADGTGSTFKSISGKRLREVEIPLPPLDEQRRIASTMELAQQARTAAAAQLEAIDTLSVALLRKISPPSPAARLPRGWRWVKLGDVCVQERKAIAVDDVGYVEMPYLGLEHVEPTTGRLLIDGQGNRDSATKSTNFRFSPRHVLYGKLRPYLNKVARPTFSGRCTTEFIPLLPIQADADWLAWILRRDETVAHAMRGKTGSRMPRASMPDLMRLPVALPPLDEQRGIADTMGNVQCMRESAAQQLALVDDLNQSQLERLLGMPMETGIVGTCPSHQP